jgi:hypothetical protein
MASAEGPRAVSAEDAVAEAQSGVDTAVASGAALLQATPHSGDSGSGSALLAPLDRPDEARGVRRVEEADPAETSSTAEARAAAEPRSLRASPKPPTTSLPANVSRTHVQLRCQYLGFYPMNAPRSFDEVDRLAARVLADPAATALLEPVDLGLPKLLEAPMFLRFCRTGVLNPVSIKSVISCNQPHLPQPHTIVAMVMAHEQAMRVFPAHARALPLAQASDADATSPSSSSSSSSPAGACHLLQFAKAEEARFALALLGRAFSNLQQALGKRAEPPARPPPQTPALAFGIAATPIFVLDAGQDHPLLFQISMAVGLQEPDKNGYIFCPTAKVAPPRLFFRHLGRCKPAPASAMGGMLGRHQDPGRPRPPHSPYP